MPLGATFDIPGGKISMDKAISSGAIQVAAFLPISVIHAKGQWGARDGNSRGLSRPRTKAPVVAALDESSCEEKRRDLPRRLKNNGLPLEGTSKVLR